jgi:AcrR family transcriptional regulator
LPRPGDGLRARKRQETHQRIADEAARLVTDRGVAGTTIDDIAAAAKVGRATFFRYFDSKEVAVAEGFSTPWLTLIVEALAAQPGHLDPLEAVVAAFGTFAEVVDTDRETILRQSRLSVSTPGLQAWTLQLFTRVEEAIAAIIAPRFVDLRTDDPRPRMLGALTMAAVRLSTERWLASDAREDLPRLVRESLSCISIHPPFPALAAAGSTAHEEVAL